MADKPPGKDDSLDFTPPPPPAAPAAGAKPPAPSTPRKPTPAARPAATAPAPRRSFVPLLLLVGVGAVIAFVMIDGAPDAPKPPPKPAPAPYQTAPAPPTATTPKPPPAPKPAPSATPATPQPAKPGVLPDEFLKIYKEHTTRTGGKAIALAIDSETRWVYGSVAGFANDTAAIDDALAECARHRNQAGIQASCRIYAVGDKVIW